jgi:hypothetical protein
LASNNLADYSVISRKNVFGIGYRDPLAETVVTAITWRNGQPRVWITDGTGEVVKLSIGEELGTPDFRGRIVSAGDNKVVFAQGDAASQSKVVVAIGDCPVNTVSRRSSPFVVRHELPELLSCPKRSCAGLAEGFEHRLTVFGEAP